MKLTKGDVLTIFSQRAQVNCHESDSLTSKQLAAKCGISERTVRDIWTRRSRTNITKPAWTVDEVKGDKEKQPKKKGRPPGAKDTAPRKRSGTSSSEQATNSSDSGSAPRETSSSDSGSAPRTKRSVGGTAHKSDTTASQNHSSGDSGENSNVSQQENSSSASGQENSSSGSGSSSPHETSDVLSTSEQNARNAQLNQAVLSLINTDWRHSVTSQHTRNNLPAPVKNQQQISTPQSFMPFNTQSDIQSATQLARFGSGLQQLLASWQSQIPAPPAGNNTSFGSLQQPLGCAQVQHAPDCAHQVPPLSSASTNAYASSVQIAHGRAAAPPQQSYVQPYTPSPNYAQEYAPATPSFNTTFNLPLKRRPSCDQSYAPSPSQRFKFDTSTGAQPAVNFVDPVSLAGPASVPSFKLEVPAPTLGSYGQAQLHSGLPSGILDGSYSSSHQQPPAQQQQLQHALPWQLYSQISGQY